MGDDNKQNVSAKLTSDFKEEKEIWTNKLDTLAKQFYRIEDVVDTEIEIHSSMARVNDKRKHYRHIYNKLNKKFREKRGDNIEDIYNSNYRFNAKEKEAILESDLSSMYYTMDTLELFIGFYDDVYAQLNSMTYMVKNRIELEKILLDVK